MLNRVSDLVIKNMEKAELFALCTVVKSRGPWHYPL